MRAHWIRRIVTVGATLVLIAGSALLADTGAQAATSHNPIGHLDHAGVDDYNDFVTADGWAIDPDYTTGATSVQILVDGKVIGTAKTNQADDQRPDVQKVYPKYGPDNGWQALALPAPNGRGNHSLCATAINRGSGANTSLGCLTIVQTFALNVIGHIDSITHVSGTTYRITGWVLDPSDAVSPTAFVLHDGASFWNLQASAGLPRPDVDRAYPKNGHNHGFDVTDTEPSADLPNPGDRICISTQVLGDPVDFYDTPYCATWPS